MEEAIYLFVSNRTACGVKGAAKYSGVTIAMPEHRLFTSDLRSLVLAETQIRRTLSPGNQESSASAS